jgi:hypothetical protein
MGAAEQILTQHARRDDDDDDDDDDDEHARLVVRVLSRCLI